LCGGRERWHAARVTRPACPRLRRALLRDWGSRGPTTARLFHRALALVQIAAWVSLLAQVVPLLGSRGLSPAAGARLAGLSYTGVPTLFLFVAPSDTHLVAGAWLGLSLAVLSLAGVAPRVMCALQVPLYLSYVTLGGPFFSFQWDNLLLETTALAVLLPRGRSAFFAHFALRVLLFKIYFQSGLAKLNSPIHDWQDGSAMTFYYETAPLPGPLGHWFHNRSASFHAFEGSFTLFFELLIPFLIFAPRLFRRAPLALFTGFQAVNLATANYGFFVYLALALHLLLLGDADALAARRLIAKRAPRLHAAIARGRALRLSLRRRAVAFIARWLDALARRRIAAAARALPIGLLLLYLYVSYEQHERRFGDSKSAPATGLRAALEPFRVVNVYHLFAAITRDRIEPEVEIWDGQAFRRYDLHYKPGDPSRRPPLVAPHQPRLDFQLWFYGLSARRGQPPYAAALLDRLCHDPAAVQSFFRDPLPPSPEKVRLSFTRYRMTSREELDRTGAYWQRALVGSLSPVACRSPQNEAR
jgi:lipase maturation factor 1